MAREFKLELDPSLNVVFDEAPGSNSFLALRRLKWSDNSPFRVDIRKWFTNAEGEEIAGKGVSFMTPEGPGNLINALLENGFGDTRETISSLKNREDFAVALKEVIVENNIDLDSINVSIDQLDGGASFYDPKSIL